MSLRSRAGVGILRRRRLRDALLGQMGVEGPPAGQRSDQEGTDEGEAAQHHPACAGDVDPAVGLQDAVVEEDGSQQSSRDRCGQVEPESPVLALPLVVGEVSAGEEPDGQAAEDEQGTEGEERAGSTEDGEELDPAPAPVELVGLGAGLDAEHQTRRECEEDRAQYGGANDHGGHSLDGFLHGLSFPRTG